MPETWLSYRQLGELWKTTPEAARARARRGRFPRRTNNVGAVEIMVDTDAPVPEPRQKPQNGQLGTTTPSDPPDAGTASQAALAALEGHIATLKDQLARAEAATTAERERVADLTAQVLKITTDLLDAQRAAAATPRSWWARLVG